MFSRYHVPRKIARHVDYVTPGIRLIAPKGASKKRSVVTHLSNQGGKRIRPSLQSTAGNNSLANCDTTITPACVAALYNIPPVEQPNATRADNSLGIFEEGDYYDQEDLDLFFAKYTSIPKGMPSDSS
jgi:tripeptidyl-peptidase-1